MCRKNHTKVVSGSQPKTVTGLTIGQLVFAKVAGQYNVWANSGLVVYGIAENDEEHPWYGSTLVGVATATSVTIGGSNGSTVEIRY